MLAVPTRLAGIRHETFRCLAQAIYGSVRRFYQKTDRNTSQQMDSYSGDLPEPVQHSVDDFKGLIRSEEDQNLIHLILLEIDCVRDETGEAPWNIPLTDMRELMELSPTGRRKYFGFMHKKQLLKFVGKLKRTEKREAREAQGIIEDDDPEIPNTIYAFIRKRSQFDQLQGLKLMREAMFGQKLLFDCSFEDRMTRREVKASAKQMQNAYSMNKAAKRPFDLTFCSFNLGGYFHSTVQDYFLNYDGFPFLIDMIGKSYLDLVPKEKLIYLSPDAPTPLLKWDHDAHYIIGAMIDLGNQQPVTLARAKEQGLRCARLPLKEMVILRPGQQRSLPIHLVVRLLLEFRDTNDWKQAFKLLPGRYSVGEAEQAEIQHKRELKRKTYQQLVRRKNKIITNIEKDKAERI